MTVCEQPVVAAGTGLVSGIGCGKPFLVQPEWFYEKTALRPFETTEKELDRLQHSLQCITTHLEKLHTDFEKEKLVEEAEIVFAQLSIVQEGTLVCEIQNTILDRLCTVEKAVSVVKQEIKGRFSHNAGQTNRTFELVEDIFVRLVSETKTDQVATDTLSFRSEKSVLVAEMLLPSRATELLQRGFVAIVTKRGGLMSHAALLARSKNIPFVTNILQQDWERLVQSESILVDGRIGSVYVNPSKEFLLSYQKKNKTSSVQPVRKEKTSLVTTDGNAIQVFASVEYFGSLGKKEVQTADGIGLYRSEYLVQELGYLPHEETQVSAFHHLIDIADHKPVTIRVYDFSGDKRWIIFEKSQASFQGHPRSLTELLSSPSIFFPHIRAIVRSALSGKVSILFPMISSLHDLKHCRKIVDAARLSIAREEKMLPEIQIGAMVELPSIICQLPELLQEVDFIALGTNDLVQYCLAISRVGGNFCDRSSYLHEGFLCLLKYVADVCSSAKKTCVVCGELVSDPGMRMVLLGLGFSSFTVPVSLVSEAKKNFSKLSVQEAKQFVDKLFSLQSASDRFQWLEEWKKNQI